MEISTVWTTTEKNITKEFKSDAASYLETVQSSINMMLNHHEHTIEEVFNYLKRDSGNKSMAGVLLTLMKEDRLDRSANLEELSDYNEISKFFSEQMNEYTLEFNYDSGDEHDYFRYLITYGGPSVEIRIYEYGMEFNYAWGNQEITYNIMNTETATLLRDYFDGMCMLNFEEQREPEHCHF